MIDARITDITQAAGMSHAAFYRYFDSKEEILKEVSDVAHRNVFAAVGTAGREERQLPSFIRFSRANRRYLDAWKANAQILRVVEQRLATDPAFVDISREMVETFVPRLERTLERLQRGSGIEGSLDVRYTAAGLSAMVQRVAYVTFVMREGTAMRERTVQTIDMLWGNVLGLPWDVVDLAPLATHDAGGDEDDDEDSWWERRERPDVRPPASARSQRPKMASAKGAATRDALITAARRVFERDGYLDARVADITATAGVAHGTFYNYFTDRLDAFQVVAATLHDEIISALVARRRDRSATTLQRITSANEAFFDIYRRNARLFTVIEQVATIDAECASLRLGLRNWFIEHNERTIAAMQARGEADARLHSYSAAEALCCMIERLAFEWFVLRVDVDPDVGAGEVSRVWVRALGIDA